MTAEYYLSTVEQVFIKHALATGRMFYRDHLTDPGAVRRVALMTVEGENDDITGTGQCKAAHDLCCNLPAHMKAHHLQPKVGHYGVFNGSRFRADIVPAIGAFTRQHDLHGSGPLKRALKQMRGSRRMEIAPGSVAELLQPALAGTLSCANGRRVGLRAESRRAG